MEQNPTYYIDLIIRYFSGETSSDELLILRDWLAQDKANQQMFDEYNRTWQHLEKKKIEDTIHIDDEWQKFQSRIASESDADPKIIKLHPDLKPTRKSYLSLMKYAAVFVVVALSSIFLFRYMYRPQEKVITASNQTVQTMLADSSDITLGIGSTITYPEKFKIDKRRVKLSGEAYFNVKHIETQPFVVSAGDVRVEVLGTSFYVNTNAVNNNVEVVLTSGKVAVYYKDNPNERTVLNPGEKALASLVSKKIIKTKNDDENYMAWKTKKIVFTDDPLNIVVPILNKVYRSDIKLTTNSIADCRITATFDAQSLDAVLNVLKETLDLNVSRKGNTIEISGNACK